MPEAKADILREFNQLLAEYQILLKGIHPHANRNYLSNSPNYIAPEDQAKFFQLRTRSLQLLQKINSPDTNVQQAIDFIRSVDAVVFNIEQVFYEMQRLHSDYEADILTKRPRITPKEKRPLLTNELTLIIVAIISLAGVIGSALISRSTVTVIATPTPTWTPTTTETATLSPTPTLFLTPTPGS